MPYYPKQVREVFFFLTNQKTHTVSKSILVVFGDIEFLPDNVAKVHSTKYTALYPEEQAVDLAEERIASKGGDYIIPSQYAGTIKWEEVSQQESPMTVRELIAMLQEEAEEDPTVLDKPVHLYMDDGPIALTKEHLDFDISDRIDINVTLH